METYTFKVSHVDILDHCGMHQRGREVGREGGRQKAMIYIYDMEVRKQSINQCSVTMATAVWLQQGGRSDHFPVRNLFPLEHVQST